jgi:hyperosmotically inducible periplasmic protein
MFTGMRTKKEEKIIMKGILGLGLSFLLFAGIASSSTGHYKQDAAKEPENTMTTNEKQLDDATITSAIKGKLEADKIVRQSAIDVDSSNGFVTLNGVVETQAEIDRAVELAKAVDGVRQVTSNLKIDVSTPPNNSTTKKMTENVKATADDMGSSVQGHAENAAENTESTVKEGAEKAETAVKDTAITTAVKTKFAADDTVSASSISVETTNGVVHLSGTVKSKAEADKAIQIAKKVDGVKKVKSALVVKPS